jgi:replicative DNA helicase
MERFGEMMKFYSGAQNTREGIEMIEEMKNLYIYDDLRSVNEIALEIKRQNMIEQVDLIVLDHLQDMSSTNDRQYESINEICEMIKDLSIKLNIPSIIVSQLNRQGTRETTKDKFVFSFTGSGKIEQIAQVAMVILRDVDDNSKTYCKIVKNRGNVDTPKCGTGLVLMEQLNTYNFVPVNYHLKEHETETEKMLGDL